VNILDQIRQKTSTEFRPASPADPEAPRTLPLPEDVLAFYRQAKPVKYAEIGKVRLWPIRNISETNKDYVRSYCANSCGHVVFSTTIYGDAFCFDTHSAAHPLNSAIVLIAHDLEPENDEIKREDPAKLAKPIAASFGDFLQPFVLEKLDAVPIYPTHNFLPPTRNG
jgi:hypothetical protein